MKPPATEMSPLATIPQRREYKYLVDEETAARVRAAVRPFCRLDPHAARSHTGRYTIDSIYFDTYGLALYRANIRELADRFKVRVRSYLPHGLGPVFFEVKQRRNDAISKTRGAVPYQLWSTLLERRGSDGVVHPAVERFLALYHTRRLSPVTIVRYEREPYVCRIDDDVRVTIDRRVRSQPRRAMSFEAEPHRWRAMDTPHQRPQGSMAVLELKFTSPAPRWMFDIVRSFNLFRHSSSKYSTSVQAWHQGVRRPRDWSPAA